MKTSAILLSLIFSASVFAGGIVLRDVTKQFTYGYDVVSAFPEVYTSGAFDYEENWEMPAIYHYNDPKDHESRIEIFYTGGDWMEFPFYYFITDANQTIPKDHPNCKQTQDCKFYEARAYLISDLSPLDDETEVPPVICGSSTKHCDISQEMVAKYIVEKFLDKNGDVRSDFKPLQGKND